MRDDQKNYILVGVFVVAMVAGLMLWLALLSGRTGATDVYSIRYSDVLGLSAGSTRIYFGGFPVGKIETMERVDDDDPRLFQLNVSITRGWQIPQDSVAKITAGSLLASLVINIESGDSTTFLQPGDQIPSEEAANLMEVVGETAASFSDFLVQTLKPQITAIVDDLNATMNQVKALLSQENTGRVAAILANLEGVSVEVEGIAGGLDGTQDQLDDVLRRIDSVLVQVSELISQNEDDIGHSIDDLHESLEAVARHADAIANNLEVTTRNMDEFSQQIREDPGVLLRGREAAKEPGAN
jgi:phospholipid/cholesterol/gamma-HCH transport system substrate-binding protein